MRQRHTSPSNVLRLVNDEREHSFDGRSDSDAPQSVHATQANTNCARDNKASLSRGRAVGIQFECRGTVHARKTWVRRIPALDGVRGIAILAVLFAHCFPAVPGAQFGVLGVDLFFVLSGFLITGILLDSVGQPGYFSNFYERRVLRLFPLAFLYFGILAWVMPLLYKSANVHIPVYGGSWWWYLLYVANLKPNSAATDPGLGQFWSLAVEEQFYLIWPALILTFRRRRLAIFCFLLVIGSLALRTIWMLNGVSGLVVYRHTLTRCDSLAVGALLSLAVRYSMKVQLWPAVACGLVYICSCLLIGYDEHALWVRTIGQLLIEIAFAGLVLYAHRTNQGWLAFKPLRVLGKYSYCLYVVHVLVLIHVSWLVSFLRLPYKPELTVGFPSVVISLCVAALSWRYLEKPIEEFKNRPSISTEAKVAA